MAAKKKPTKTTASKKTTARKNAPQPKQTASGEVLGMVIMGLAIVSFILLVTTDATNPVKSLIEGISGIFSFVTCAIMLWVGLLVTFIGKKALNGRRIAMISLALLIAYTLVHLFFVRDMLGTMLVNDWLGFISESFFTRKGTGAIGALLSYPIYSVFKEWAGAAVLIILLGIDVVLLKNISLRTVGEQAQTYIEKNYQDFRVKQEERSRIRREEVELRRQQRAAARTAWNSDDATLEPTASPHRPISGHNAEKSEPALEVPDFLKNGGSDRRQKPVFGDNSVSITPFTRRKAAEQTFPTIEKDDLFDAQTSDPYIDADETEPMDEPMVEPVKETPVRTSLYGFPKENAPTYDEPAADVYPEEHEPASDVYEDEPIDITNYPEMNETPAEEIQADIEDDQPAYDSDDDLFDGFDDDEDERPPFDMPKERERHRPVLGEAVTGPAAAPVRVPQEPKPSFTDAPMSDSTMRRLDHTPIVTPQRDTSHDLTPTGSEYNYPPVDLLAVARPVQSHGNQDKDQEKAQKLEDTLREFGINATLTDIAHGPAVTRFELAPAPGVKVSRITALTDDIALRLAATSVRIEAPIPGKAAVGVEIPNDEVETVPLREVLESQEARKNASRLAVAMGKDNGGRYIVGDIAKMPHVLIAGATGSGKSVCINCIICSILYRATPDEVRLIMIDPKVVELSIYNGIPHLLVPVVTDPKKASGALHWAVVEMTDRYKKFADKGVRDIKGYNKACAADGQPMMPQIVIIIDELADLMMVCPGEVEDSICRLAQLARAAGIHLVIATQRPSVNVITGVIKANIPARIAFTVASFVDSRTILDVGGAEKLLGRGDMLFAPAGSNKMQRVQGAWVSDDEIHSIVDYIKNRHEAAYNADLDKFMEDHEVQTDEEAEEDASSKESDKLLPQAVEIAINAGQVSISMLQRKLSIGYARAGRLVDEMATRGYISQAEGAKPRSVTITREEFAALFGGKND